MTNTTAVPKYQAEYKGVHYRGAIFAHFTQPTRTFIGRATRGLEERIFNLWENKGRSAMDTVESSKVRDVIRMLV